MDYKAFVSSTFMDLQHHRAHVIRELRKAGFSVDPMEEWTSAAQEPKVLSTNRLDGCKLCVLLVARRRGHVPDGERLSITQMEADEAKRRGIDVLTFLLDDGISEADWPWDERDKPEVEAWRKDIREHAVVSKFTKGPASIDLSPALVRWVKDKGADVALDLYLNLVEQEHGTIQFLGMPQLKDNPNAPIHRLYVEPAVADRWVSPDMDPKEWPKTEPVLDAVVRHPAMVLLGDPGSGKSTLVSWVAWQLAKHYWNATSPWTEGLGRLVPLPFILRNLGIGRGVTWGSLLQAFLDQPMAKLLGMTDLDKILRDGRAIVMLDGLDEIGNPETRRTLREAVWEGMEKFPQCRWLLTSRIVGYDEVAFHERRVPVEFSEKDQIELELRGPPRLRPGMDVGDAGRAHRWFSNPMEGEEMTRVVIAEVHYVVPFDDARVNQFSDNWFTLRVETEFNRQELLRAFVEAVRAHDSTRKLGRIPNLLTMMALIFRVRARLPHGRALLYNEIAQAYLETIEFVRKLPGHPGTLGEKKRWLARVGFEMQRRRGAKKGASQTSEVSEQQTDEILASGNDVRRWIAAAMAESGKGGSNDDAARFVEFLARRSGLLLPRGEDQFAFLHLSFQEYFAACFLQDQIVSPDWQSGGAGKVADGASKKEVSESANEPLWRETLILLVELFAHEQPRWLPALRECLFGADVMGRSSLVRTREHGWWDRLLDMVRRHEPQARDNGDRVMLLARLAIDPQAGFVDSDRGQAIRACWHWEFAEQKKWADRYWARRALVAHTLLTADKGERLAINELLVEAAKELQVTTLSLANRGVSDLSPLAGLSGLNSLKLYKTPVSDLSPLAGLSGLTSLDLSATPVSDLSPLAGLSGLTWLNLNGTQVSDLSPLAGLSGLTWLDLRNTRVSDLSPLAGLSGLTWVELRNTPVSDLSPLAGLTKLSHVWVSARENLKIPESLRG
ncbi:MAG: leucine-rich repeat domain-containing protein, partial [Planctomycetaceae bacterium]|nr:leucine-rich repeat domain-containing protein [Planctomycetaceae bacterium]